MFQQGASEIAQWQGCEISANGAVSFCDQADLYSAHLQPAVQSMAIALETIETPLWALLMGAVGLIITSLLIGFALGVAITVGAMGLMANAALVLSYLTLSVSVAAGSVSLLCWRG